ncbi:DUF4105 domain-containing protein [Leptospira sp. WS39.C2]
MSREIKGIWWAFLIGFYLSFPIDFLLADPNSILDLDLEKTKQWGSFSPKSNEDKILLQSILEEARVRRYYQHPLWLRLLHYESKRNGDYKSKVVNPRFFLAERGENHPNEELEATIRSFFVEEPIPEGLIHPICSFPARHHFIKQMFGVDFLKRKNLRCDRFETWKESLQVDSVSVVFVSYYLASPASVFGHTMLKFNQKTNVENGSELLDYAVNAAADVPNTDPFRYAYYGLFGGYKAKFALFPYYLKVNEYNDLESRDLWEYRLSLNEGEVDLLVSHLWELSRAEFDYYFLNANCGSFLVDVLDVIKPNLNLKEKLGGVVSPVDTIKIIVESKEFVIDKKYRPSLYSEILYFIQEMDTEEKKVFFEMVDKNQKEVIQFSSYESKESSLRLPLVMDAFLLTSRYQSHQKLSKNKINSTNYQTGLEFRSKFPDTTKSLLNVKVPPPPEGTHSKSRIVLGGGTSNLGHFLEWRYRFAYHDLLNFGKGSPPNGELVFLDGTIRQYEGKKIEFTSFTLVRLLSLSPYNSISKQWSYLLDLGFLTTMVRDEHLRFWELGFEQKGNFWQRKQVPNLDLAFGWTFADEFSKTKDNFGTLSFLFGFKSQLHPHWERGGRYGPNVQTMYQKEWGNWKLLGGLHFQHYIGQMEKNQTLPSVTLRYLFSPISEVRLQMKQEPHYQEVSCSFHYLF